MAKDEFDKSIRDILSFLSPKNCELILSNCKILDMSPGDVLFSCDDPADSLFFVVSGRVAVKQKTGFDERMQVVGLLDAGTVVGEGCLAKGLKRATTVVSAVDSKLVKIEGKILQSYIESDPQMGVELYEYCLHKSSLRLRENTRRLAYIL